MLPLHSTIHPVQPLHDAMQRCLLHGAMRGTGRALIFINEFEPNLNVDENTAHPLQVRLIRSIRKKNTAMQLLLFSATFNDAVKKFAMQIAPKANHLFVAKEQLSLDVIAQVGAEELEGFRGVGPRAMGWRGSE
eukprot:174723-Chlamydomonas_euryale.AAC.1